MYTLKDTVELVSTYQYPEKAHQAVLSDQFLYVITRYGRQILAVHSTHTALLTHKLWLKFAVYGCRDTVHSEMNRFFNLYTLILSLNFFFF